MQIADRISRLGTETSFVVLARARELEAQGKDIIHLEIGEPDFDTAPNIIEAAKNALDAGYTHYGPAAGLPQFRKTIAEVEGARRGLEFKPEMVVVTPGAKPIMYYAIMAIVNPGDEVIYPNPGSQYTKARSNSPVARPFRSHSPKKRDSPFPLTTCGNGLPQRRRC